MKDVLYYRHYSDPISEIPYDEFFSYSEGRVKNIVVLDVNEKEYWEGMQLISGQQYNVILKDDLSGDRKHRQFVLQGIFYTYDPLDRSS